MGVAILILKMEENTQHFWHIMLYCFKKGKNTTETRKKMRAVYGEGAVTEHVESGLWSFVLEISCWTMLHGWVDKLKLIAIKRTHWEQSVLYQIGDRQHTQNIQINKVIGDNEKNLSFILWEKKPRLFGQPNSMIHNTQGE